jgi:hypothetical protein
MSADAQNGAAMSTKLLIAGVALTFLALRSEEKLPKPAVAVADKAEVDVVSSTTRRAFGRVGNSLEFVVAQSVSESLSNSEQILAFYGQQAYGLEGENGKRARRAAEDVEAAVTKAREELDKNRTFKAMDHAMHASNRADDLRRILVERR